MTTRTRKPKAKAVRRKLTPYQRILRNAERYRGVKLSAREVQELADDDAIRMVAWNDDNDGAEHT